jgi:hypothetical protein
MTTPIRFRAVGSYELDANPADGTASLTFRVR